MVVVWLEWILRRMENSATLRQNADNDIFPKRTPHGRDPAMEDSVSCWITRLKQGNADAAGKLWDVYFRRLTGLASARLGRQPRRLADEEDVALSVFDSLCRGAARGNFPKLTDRDNLWALLVVITSRKVCDYVTAERAQKRGGGQVRAASDLAEESLREAAALDAVLSREPTPDMTASFDEECDRLLQLLEPDLRQLALGKLAGATNEELATELQCGLRTIERRLTLIRKIWKEAATGN